MEPGCGVQPNTSNLEHSKPMKVVFKVDRPPDVWAKLNETGPCGYSKSIKVLADVEVFNVPMSRRSHTNRKCSSSDKEGSGGSPVPPWVSDKDKWHAFCKAIRDANNLVIEVGSRQVCTNCVVPYVSSVAVNRSALARMSIKL